MENVTNKSILLIITNVFDGLVLFRRNPPKWQLFFFSPFRDGILTKNLAEIHCLFYFCLCVGCSAITFTFHTSTV